MKLFAACFLLLGAATLHAQTRVTSPQAVGSLPEQGSRTISRKLANNVLPEVEFRETPLSNAIAYLSQMSRQDDRDPDPQARGVNIILQSPPGGLGAAGNARITLSLRNVPLSVVLQYVANAAGLQMRVEPHAVILSPLSSEATPTLETAEFRVPPTFFGSHPAGTP